MHSSEGGIQYTYMVSIPKKDINLVESVQRKYTRIIFNKCNISYTSYFDRPAKINIKSLEDWNLTSLVFFSN